MAVEILNLNSGQHFVISRSANNHCGYETIVVRQYNPNRYGFEYGFIASEGIAGQYQALRFRTREDAQNFINEKFPNEDARVGAGKGPVEVRRIPLADYDTDGYVNEVKFTRTPDNKLERWKEECPAYMDEDAPGPDNTYTSQTSGRRYGSGFFN